MASTGASSFTWLKVGENVFKLYITPAHVVPFEWINIGSVTRYTNADGDLAWYISIYDDLIDIVVQDEYSYYVDAMFALEEILNIDRSIHTVFDSWSIKAEQKLGKESSP